MNSIAQFLLSLAKELPEILAWFLVSVPIVLHLVLIGYVYPHQRPKIDRTVDRIGKVLTTGAVVLVSILLAVLSTISVLNILILDRFDDPNHITIAEVNNFTRNFDNKLILELIVQGYNVIQFLVIITTLKSQGKGLLRWADALIPALIFIFGAASANMFKFFVLELAATNKDRFNWLLISLFITNFSLILLPLYSLSVFTRKSAKLSDGVQAEIDN